MPNIFCCCKRPTIHVLHNNKVTFLLPVLAQNSRKISSQIKSTTRNKSLTYNDLNLKQFYPIPLTSNFSDDDDDYDDLEDGSPPSDMEVRHIYTQECA